jgi:hypothetical protein
MTKNSQKLETLLVETREENGDILKKRNWLGSYLIVATLALLLLQVVHIQNWSTRCEADDLVWEEFTETYQAQIDSSMAIQLEMLKVLKSIDMKMK